MRKKKKNFRSGKKRQVFLAACVAAALLCSTPTYAVPKLAGEPDPDIKSVNADYPNLLIDQNETKTTWANRYQNNDGVGAGHTENASVGSVTYSGMITVAQGAIWRPMDAANSIAINKLELQAGALLDVSYKYGANLGDSRDYPAGATYWPAANGAGNNYARMFTINEAILHDGAIMRLNVGGGRYTIVNGEKRDSLQSDRVTLYGDKLQLPDGAATVLLQIRYNKNTGGALNAPAGASAIDHWALTTAPVVTGTITSVVRVYNVITTKAADGTILTTSPAEGLTFVADRPYYVDSSLNKYYFVPILNPKSSDPAINKDPVTGDITENFIQSYDIDWTATRSDLVSQGIFSAANAQLSLRNLWRIEDGLFWKRGEDLRAANRLGQSEGADGAWAQIWRGKYDFAGAYGSDFGQSYNGIQLGYDKQREGDFYGGKLYTGLFLSMMNSDADFHQHSKQTDTGEALYSRSAGDLKSNGIGLYTSWLGDKGHYLDLTVRGSKLKNKYQFYDSDENPFENDYGTWAYGAGLRYGFQKELPGGWYLEPQVGLSYGTMRGYSYIQSNGMRYNQEEMDMLTGRFGLTAGRNFACGEKRGIVYAKAAVNHEFKDGGRASADAGSFDKKGQYYPVRNVPVNTLGGKDTWYEFAVGANLQTGKDQNAFLELSKTAGGKVNTDWQVNAGMAWRFNGPSPQDRAAELDGKLTSLAAGQAEAASVEAQAAAPGQAGTANGLSPIADDSSGVTRFAAAAPAEPSVPVAQAGQASQADQPTVAEHTPGQAAVAFAAGDSANNTVQVTADNSEPGTYALTPLVVEAARPDWEKKLSPGTVSVIHVSEYKGEMKNLPDLLQTVPGVYIQRLQGTGHYTVARVRGSTGGQVNIYMDGVLINSNADAAVDLSVIPVENVERIEVYRGYVPARFAGAPIGGAINIVTKKPQDTRGSISQGMRSFGGYTGSLELTAPVGSGSMLFALNRDQAKGDFRYTNVGAHVVHDSPTQERRRLFNDYQNTDALLKWQDDNWFAKLTWQRNQTSFPQTTIDVYADVPMQEIIDRGLPYGGNYNQYRHRQLDTTKTEFQFGRRQTAGDLEWGWKLDTSYQLKRAASSQSKNSQNNAFATVDNDFRNRRYEGSIDGSWQVGDNHLVEFLFNASRETMDVRAYNHDMWPPNVTSVGNHMAFYKDLFKSHYQTNTYHFQVQDTMTLNKSGNLFFTPLFRAQKMDMDVALGDPDLGSWKYSYGLGLKKVQNEHWTFRGTYGTYYKFPNWYDLFGDGVNVKSRWEMYRDLAGSPQFLLNNFVERGTSWDISANWQGRALQADSDVTLTYFNRDSKNLSSYAIDFYGWGYYTNLGAGQIRGVELESKMNWKRWDLLLSATWNDSLVTQSGKDSIITKAESQAGNPFPWIPEWEYNARLSYRFPGDKLAIFGEYHYLDRVGVVRLSGTGTMFESLGITNVGLKYDINKQIKLTAGVNDLFNKGPNQPMVSIRDGVEKVGGNVYYPQQGRTYYMTAQYFF
ncbi:MULTISPECIES: TonB-dependent receptor domain-containing protein [Sporomusa]|uniref:TonB-dependent receptor domain-containing protein n=1 Tax=Sporomusa TaxID=2375 RepID=UPI003158CF22